MRLEDVFEGEVLKFPDKKLDTLVTGVQDRINSYKEDQQYINDTAKQIDMAGSKELIRKYRMELAPIAREYDLERASIIDVLTYSLPTNKYDTDIPEDVMQAARIFIERHREELLSIIRIQLKKTTDLHVEAMQMAQVYGRGVIETNSIHQILNSIQRYKDMCKFNNIQ